MALQKKIAVFDTSGFINVVKQITNAKFASFPVHFIFYFEPSSIALSKIILADLL